MRFKPLTLDHEVPSQAGKAAERAQSAIGKLSANDIDLLRACLCDGDAATSSFHRWRSEPDLWKTYDEAQHRLFPLLHHNLVSLGITDPILPKLKQIRIQSWFQGQKRLFAAEQVVDALSRNNINVMVTKGMAMIQGYYANVELRPMSDIDIVVRLEQVDDAIDVLSRLGWKNALAGSESRYQFHALLIGGTAQHFERVGEPDIDLHVQPFRECRDRDTRNHFWLSAERILIGNTSCMRPSPECSLLHVIIHGTLPNKLNPMRWIADAAMIMRRQGQQLDWAEINDVARRVRVMSRLQLGLERLEYVLGEANAPKPDSFTPSLLERLELFTFQVIKPDTDVNRRRSLLTFISHARTLLGETIRNPVLWIALAQRRLLGRRGTQKD